MLERIFKANCVYIINHRWE